MKDFLIATNFIKDQNLSLNPGKISGSCGRLMCCIKYEEEVYRELNKKLPRVGDTATTEDGFHCVVDSVNILVPGICVELNSGSKALVITENKSDFFRPMVLSFDDNQIMDLSNSSYSDIEITDIMKTMDNRHVIDTEMLKSFGM